MCMLTIPDVDQDAQAISHVLPTPLEHHHLRIPIHLCILIAPHHTQLFVIQRHTHACLLTVLPASRLLILGRRESPRA